MEKWSFGLSRQEVLDVVQTYTQNNNLKTKFKNGPGEDWFISFARRNKLSIKKPQGVEYLRMTQINPFVIYGFFYLLTKTIDGLKLREKPQQTFNLDETSFCHDPKKMKVVDAIGVPSTRMISSAGRENTSELICTSASGQKLPPLVIFKGKNIIESWIGQNVRDETAYAASKRGWMESRIFLNWFKKCFLPNIPQEQPTVLIYDGHSAHVRPHLCKVAIENEVTIVKLPPHTTHVLQPLDVSIFGPFKTDWDRQLVKWQCQNPRKRIPKREFVELLNKVYNDVATENIKIGFKSTGIYDEARVILGLHPVNQQAIKDSIFKPDDLKRYQDQKKKNNIEQPPTLAEVSTDTQAPNLDNLVSGIMPSVPLVEPDPVPSMSTNAKEVITNDDQNTTTNTVELNVLSPPVEASALPTTQTYNQPPKSFEEILLGLVRNTKEGSPPAKKRRVCTGVEIITTKGYMEQLLKENEAKDEKEKAKEKNSIREKEKQKKTDTKVVKATKTKGKKYVDSSSSSDVEEDVVLSESEEEVSNFVEVIHDDYVIVNFNGEYYPGRVISIDSKENSIRVKHMQKCGKSNVWRWPEKDDFVDYEQVDIFEIIKDPAVKNNRNMYNVPEMDIFIN